MADILQEEGVPTPRRYVAILALSLGTAVTVIDGAIANVAGGTLEVTHSTFTGNESVGTREAAGGAIANDAGSSLTVAHSTFTANQAIGADASAGDGWRFAWSSSHASGRRRHYGERRDVSLAVLGHAGGRGPM